jgi:uncharacterized protein with HEPN domain
MHADARKLLWDARHAAELVAKFTRGKSFGEYEADDLLRSGVERQLAIVGEALNRLRKIDPTTASAIADLPRVVGFRNVLVHGYATVDTRVVWGIVEANLVSLLASIEPLLSNS